MGTEASVAVAPVGAVRRLAVVADDLTGAADAAAPVAVRGLTVAVALGEALPDVEVVAISTDNRGRPAAEARARTPRAVRRLRDAELLFVKIDSTLRGQVRADVEGALATWDAAAAVATPAFPAQGALADVLPPTPPVAGLPLGELVMGSRRVPVVTKSGGFGAPDALNRAAEALEACP